MKKQRDQQFYSSGKKAAKLYDEYLRNNENPFAERECLSVEDIEDICLNREMKQLSQEMKQTIFNRGQQKLQKLGVFRAVCGICDRQMPSKNGAFRSPKYKTAVQWTKILHGPDDVPSMLRSHYNVSDIIPSLKNALVSRAALETNIRGKETGKLFVCNQCHEALRHNKLPKFAIANGFYIGCLPAELCDARIIERRLTSLTTVAQTIVVLSGRKHRRMRGHVSVMRMDPTPIAKRLPELLRDSDDSFLVVIAGELTPVQEVMAMRKHMARVALVENLLQFYVQHNILYRIVIDYQALSKLRTREGDAGVTFEKLEKESTSQYDSVGTCTPREEDEEEENVESQFIQTTSVHVESEPQTTLEAISIAEKTLLVRNKGEFISDFDKNLLGLAFPDLFPFGTGHPGTAREIPVSLEECCRHYLSLSNRSFSQHPSFLLVAFDVCGRQRVINSTSIRSRWRPSEFETHASVSEDDLFQALQVQKQRRQPALTGTSGNQSLSERSRASKLFRSVRISQSRMWGSSEEKLKYRRRAFSMDAFYKSGAIFVTLTPSDTGSIIVSAIAGKVNAETIQRHEVGDLFPQSKRIEIAGLDPVACCECFEIVCEVFVEGIVGFNVKKSLPFKSGGIFGIVKAFVDVVESQKSGNLHLHAILFVAGLPRTFREFTSLCNDPIKGSEFKKKFCDVVNSTVSSPLPCIGSEAGNFSYPSCGAVGSLVSLPAISKVAYQRLPRNMPPPYTSKCNACGSGYGACEVLRSETQKLHETLKQLPERRSRIPYGATYRETDLRTESACLSPCDHLWPPSRESVDSPVQKMHRLRLSRVVSLTQQHNFRHVPSCFKTRDVASPEQCQYMFPRPGGMITQINEDDCLILGREHYSEYINAFSDVMALLFKANHDVRYLVGGTTDVLYYAMKYVTKLGNDSTEMEKAVIASYRRRRRIEEQKEKEGQTYSNLAAGRARVNSMAAALSRMQEVPSPLCALYLRRKTAMYSSHEFVPLLLAQSLAIVKGEEHETQLVRGARNGFVNVSQHMDYVCRPTSLENLPFIEFVSKYVRTRATNVTANASSSTRKETQGMSFTDRHVLQKTHCLKERMKEVIPELIGPRIPDRETSKSEQQREQFALMTLVLFMPFRNRSDLKPKDANSHWSHLLDIETSGKMTNRACELIENMQEYYISKRIAAAERSVLNEARQLYTEEEELQLRQDYVVDALEPSDGSCLTSDGFFENHCIALNGVPGNSSERIREMTRNPRSLLSVRACGEILANGQNRNQSVQHGFINPEDSEDSSEATPSREDVQKEMRRLAELVRSQKSIDSIGTESTLPLTTRDEIVTTIEPLEDSTNESENFEASKTQKQTSSEGIKYPTIEETAKLLSLKKLQTVAFEIVAREFFLRTRCKGDTTSTTQQKKIPMFYLGGSGGTGKTRVITALQHLARAWGLPNAIRTCAPTGIAAALIQGQTIHAILGLRARDVFNPKKKIARKLVEEYLTLQILIIDEVSMLSRRLLGAIDVFLRKVKEKQEPFGGVMVVLSGGFYQIPPVNSEPIFVDPVQTKKRMSLLDTLGYQLWMSLDHAIILEESMRQHVDNRYADCLNIIRRGETTNEDLDLLNKRIVSSAMMEKLRNRKPERILMVVRTNELRHSLNWAAVKAACGKSNQKPIICVADIREATGKGSHSHFQKKELEQLLSSNDSQTGNLPIILPLLPGMPIRVTQNLSVELGIANRTAPKAS